LFTLGMEKVDYRAVAILQQEIIGVRTTGPVDRKRYSRSFHRVLQCGIRGREIGKRFAIGKVQAITEM